MTNAQGYCKTKDHSYVLVDIPGTYSLMAHSAEEEVARNFICFGGSDGIVVVCDATCLERNLNLVLQTMEISDRPPCAWCASTCWTKPRARTSPLTWKRSV
ncbi:MAG: FeoB small GTPase domain-containing protein [Enterocloster bolteae]